MFPRSIPFPAYRFMCVDSGSFQWKSLMNIIATFDNKESHVDIYSPNHDYCAVSPSNISAGKCDRAAASTMNIYMSAYTFVFFFQINLRTNLFRRPARSSELTLIYQPAVRHQAVITVGAEERGHTPHPRDTEL